MGYQKKRVGLVIVIVIGRSKVGLKRVKMNFSLFVRLREKIKPPLIFYFIFCFFISVVTWINSNGLIN